MAYDPPPLISREPPRSRRHRRRAQQQSSCCCCLVVAVSLLFVLVVWRGAILSVFKHERPGEKSASTAFPLELSTDATAYLRYNLVRFEATVVDARGNPVMVAKPPVVVVSYQGQVVSTVGEVAKLPLRYDRNLQKYVMTWPVPWNAPPGQYVAEADIAIADPAAWEWETAEQKKERLRLEKRKEQAKAPEMAGPTISVAEVRFTINARPIADIPPGTCIATWEPDFTTGRIDRPDGSRGDWKAMFDWCVYMGADTFWSRGAVTEAYNGKLTDAEPFNTDNIEQIPMVAAEAHRRGLKFGTWAAAYATYPESNNRNKPPYRFAQDISLGSGAIKATDFISLLEHKRVDHLAQFFTQVQQDPNVDYVGLDYMRADTGGYEMTDLFSREMPLKLPKGFGGWARTKQWEYVAGKVEKEWQTDPHFYDAWCWWKAHKVAENLRDIIAEAKLTKPLWIFVLSWQHGKQHGQDPLMFSDAGASLLAPMLYQVPNRGHFDSMVKAWNEYVSQGQVNLAPGDQVDFYWHQNSVQPAAPEELYDRMITGHRRYLRAAADGTQGLTVGGFWHDISRAAVSGRKGPYPGTEWALAGGAAFTTIRNDWQVYPMLAELEVPRSGSLGGTVQATLTLRNIVKADVKNVSLQVEKTSGIEAVGTIKPIPSLGAGQTLTVPVTVKLKGANGARANRFMVCVRIRWPEADYGKTVRADLPRMMLVMKYVQGR